jgi:hypothetical protein
MRTQLYLLCAALAAMTLFSPASKAGCDIDCVDHVVSAGRNAADAVFNDVADGQLGKLIQANMSLIACGDKGKADAVFKLANARFKAVLAKVKLGKSKDPGLRAATMASFYSSANGLERGFALGAGRVAVEAIRVGQGVAFCQAANREADKLLFGDNGKSD